ncbi:DUF2970 domain-containing protein [Photobacterium sp. TY1-4]|uniref:DUF2970 domain-containing protein n=1 Tax=Photobacterium sp. TY1-4 TaxID=2899122 RepID=UPI0021C1FF4A|nr:DUF2970 domain-containing protein [Photobacterium sp. TY1-4]UXI01513.1 DUF2970 domain-containing protein [Photobacterium sp. TY1-4]
MNNQHPPQHPTKPGKTTRPLLSAAAALFGVQSERNRQADFSQTSARPFIVAGIVGICLFVALLIVIVRLVTAGA